MLMVHSSRQGVIIITLYSSGGPKLGRNITLNQHVMDLRTISWLTTMKIKITEFACNVLMSSYRNMFKNSPGPGQ